MFKELKEIMFKELKESVRMSHQIKTISKENYKKRTHININPNIKKELQRNSLVVHWLGLSTFIAAVQAQSLVGNWDSTSHVVWLKKKKNLVQQLK